MSGTVAGVVVLYEPSASVAANVLSYADDVDPLIVVDNSPHQSASAITPLLERPNVVYETHPDNTGVSGALNLAARTAAAKGCRYLLTMDQDSVAPAGMVAALMAVLDNDPSIGMAGPFHLDRNAPDKVPGAGTADVATLMTSGSLLRMDAYRTAGPFRDDFFIDYVDDEYCLRLQASGFRVVRANHVVLEHSQGDKTTASFFGRIVRPTHHSPERYYYQSRNRVYLRRLHGRAFPEFFRYERRLHLGRLTKMILYERDRIRKALMVARGIFAAWKGEVGRRRPR